jgi:hypothetical protein
MAPGLTGLSCAQLSCFRVPDDSAGQGGRWDDWGTCRRVGDDVVLTMNGDDPGLFGVTSVVQTFSYCAGIVQVLDAGNDERPFALGGGRPKCGKARSRGKWGAGFAASAVRIACRRRSPSSTRPP